jgi:hypothetical protein
MFARTLVANLSSEKEGAGYPLALQFRSPFRLVGEFFCYALDTFFPEMQRCPINGATLRTEF